MSTAVANVLRDANIVFHIMNKLAVGNCYDTSVLALACTSRDLAAVYTANQHFLTPGYLGYAPAAEVAEISPANSSRGFINAFNKFHDLDAEAYPCIT